MASTDTWVTLEPRPSSMIGMSFIWIGSSLTWLVLVPQPSLDGLVQSAGHTDWAVQTDALYVRRGQISPVGTGLLPTPVGFSY
jgi:hypothetical protein